jgi:hypothetical protein
MLSVRGTVGEGGGGGAPVEGSRHARGSQTWLAGGLSSAD